ncbi:MAG: glucose-6-phosphate isomerase, partial [Sulfurihydrogenibium azorense]
MIKIDYTNVMAKVISEKDGIIPQEFDEYNHIVHEIHEKIIKEKDTHFYFTKLPYQDTQDIKTLAKEIRENFDYFVVIGIGGSALGNQMIQEAINGFNYNNFEFPKLYILDNVDPEKFGNILDLIDIRKTIFNVITKSGSTVETMANFAIIYTTLKELLPDTYKNHLIFTTDPEKGFLRKFGQLEGIKTLDIPPAVGGRFSVLTSVGLLSAAVCGIDIDALLEGARKADEICSKTSIVIENPAYLIGLIHYIAAEKK